VSRNLLSLSQTANLDPRTVEAELLTWASEGVLAYTGLGRDMLVSLPPAPPDANERITAMLAEYQAGQDGRTGEIMAYATTSRCRHGHISAYFGGRPLDRCQACDNCLGLVVRPAPARQQKPRSRRAGPTPSPVADPARAILEGVAQLPYPVGRENLVRALQGARTSSLSPERFPAFGTMGAYTQKQIGGAVMVLLRQGLVEYFKKGEYTLLRLTPQGHAYLEGEEPWADGDIDMAPRKRPDDLGDVIEGQIVDIPDYDRGLFERLRAWRLAQAREEKVPPYIVFSDATLKEIAAAKPATLRELDAVKGVGPTKLEKYGQAVLDIVAGTGT
jgi:ATP-dependent DNA helicase RecQ